MTLSRQHYSALGSWRINPLDKLDIFLTVCTFCGIIKRYFFCYTMNHLRSDITADRENDVHLPSHLPGGHDITVFDTKEDFNEWFRKQPQYKWLLGRRYLEKVKAGVTVVAKTGLALMMVAGISKVTSEGIYSVLDGISNGQHQQALKDSIGERREYHELQQRGIAQTMLDYIQTALHEGTLNLVEAYPEEGSGRIEYSLETPEDAHQDTATVEHLLINASIDKRYASQLLQLVKNYYINESLYVELGKRLSLPPELVYAIHLEANGMERVTNPKLKYHRDVFGKPLVPASEEQRVSLEQRGITVDDLDEASRKELFILQSSTHYSEEVQAKLNHWIYAKEVGLSFHSMDLAKQVLFLAYRGGVTVKNKHFLAGLITPGTVNTSKQQNPSPVAILSLIAGAKQNASLEFGSTVRPDLGENAYVVTGNLGL